MNNFVIEVQDEAGNHAQVFTNVVLDSQLPTIEYQNNLEVNFSNNDGTSFLSPLELNNVVPIYFTSNHLRLSGMVPNKGNLVAEGIPYFAFNISDQPLGEFGTKISELQIEYRYLINDEQSLGWQSVSLPEESSELILPFVEEIYGKAWYQALPTDEHKLELRVTDTAGNIKTEEATFYAQFYVPELNITIDIESDSIDKGDFDNRENYIGQEVVAVNYILDNSNSNESFKIRVDDDSLHSVTHEFESLQRENIVRQQIKDVWRKADIVRLDNGCPRIANNFAQKDIIDWNEVSKIWDYRGKNSSGDDIWIPLTPQNDLKNVDVKTDNPILSSISEWSDYSTTDDNFKNYNNNPNVDNFNLFYVYDYILVANKPITPISSEPSIIKLGNFTQFKPPAFEACTDIFALKTRTETTHTIIDGPKNIVSVTSQNKEFLTSKLLVFGEDSVEIIAQSGWLEIPANQKVTIVKYIETPQLTLHFDEQVSNPESINNYELHQLDKKIDWKIGRNLILDVKFDPIDKLEGIDNIRQQLLQLADKEVIFARN